jgi:heat shock protein HslJ
MMLLERTLGDARMRRLLALLLLPQACAPIEQRVSTTPTVAIQQVWALHSLAGKRVPGRIGSVATLRFAPGETVSGTIMCNFISSTKLRWTQDGGSARGGFDQMGSDAGIVTTVGCPRRPGSAVADRFWRNLETARAWSITDTHLIIAFGDGSEARLVALVSSR